MNEIYIEVEGIGHPTGPYTRIIRLHKGIAYIRGDDFCNWRAQYLIDFTDNVWKDSLWDTRDGTVEFVRLVPIDEIPSALRG
jgi:hypothetical protein